MLFKDTSIEILKVLSLEIYSPYLGNEPTPERNITPPP